MVVTASLSGVTGTRSVTIVDAAAPPPPPPPPPSATLTSIAVSGPATVNEGGTGTFTATGTWDNGTTRAIAPTWSENSSFATINSSGLLTASPVTGNQTVTVTASFSGVTGTRSVTIVDAAAPPPPPPPPPSATLTSIAVSGPATVNEGGTGTFTATGTWDNGTTRAIAPTWSENSSFATINSSGLLTASAVTGNQT